MSGLQQLPIWIYPLIVIDLVLKGIALWMSARHGQKYWFTANLVVNSGGILPLVYLLGFQKGIKPGQKNWLKQAFCGTKK